MIATNELLLEVMSLSKLKEDHNGNKHLLNPYRLPEHVHMHSLHVLYDICFELVQHRITQLSKWNGITGDLRDSMICYAMWMLHQHWHVFNAEKSKNPIAYLNTCIESAFVGAFHDFKHKRTVNEI